MRLESHLIFIPPERKGFFLHLILKTISGEASNWPGFCSQAAGNAVMGDFFQIYIVRVVGGAVPKICQKRREMESR